jgi:hypothetical protein
MRTDLSAAVGRASTNVRAAPRIVSRLMLVAMCFEPVVAQSADSDVLARSIALYPTLASYADTGTAVREAPGLVDRWKFRTYFRRSSPDFFFDFQGVTSKSAGLETDAGNHRLVFWMIKGELQSFNQTAGTHETIPRDGGNQPAALQHAGAYTAGTSILIPSLLFSKANLPGTLLQIEQATDAGFENVNGHRCHKIIGEAALYYQSGRRTNVRQVTVWIDAATLLVRKVFEDTPEGYPAGSFSRLTVTIEPQANPALDDGKFLFQVPAPRR